MIHLMSHAQYTWSSFHFNFEFEEIHVLTSNLVGKCLNKKLTKHVSTSLSTNYWSLPVTDRRSKIKRLHSFCNP